MIKREVSGSGSSFVFFPNCSVIGDMLFFVCDEEGRDVGFFVGPPGGVFRALADAAKDAWRADVGCDDDLEILPVVCVSGARGWREEWRELDVGV